MNELEKQGELVRVRKEVDRRYEAGAVIRKICDTEGPAVLFENIRDSDIPVLFNLFGTYKRVAMAFATTEADLHKRVVALLDSYPVNPKLVSTGPVKEVVLTGKEADLTRLPIPTINTLDAGPYLTFGIQIAHDPKTGIRNASVHRMQVHSKDRLGIYANPPRHLGWYIAAAEEQDKPLEVAIVVGCDPSLIMASVSDLPYDWDELALAGAFLGQPLEVVNCETIDVQVPASAEIVIEGEILPHVRESEGPLRGSDRIL
ncbi:UbiD family decarboxylase domain-containing protein [Chloroflexota bacterium]